MTAHKIGFADDIKAEAVEAEGARNVTIRWLVSEKDGAPNFAMRLFEMGTEGSTPYHSHEWEHEVYILEGKGKLTIEGDEKEFSDGYFIFVPQGVRHSFRNTGDGRLRFICVVPNR